MNLRFASIAIVFVFGMVGALFVACGAQQPPRSVAYQSRTMGTYAEVVIVTADSVVSHPHAVAADNAFTRVDSLMSNWTTTSEIARINRMAAGQTTEVHPEVALVIQRALEVSKASGGCFDLTVEPLVRTWGFLGGTPRVPDPAEITSALSLVGHQNLEFDSSSGTLRILTDGVRLDLGGIAKGYGVDKVAATLEERGVTDALINLSGNMTALGSPPGRDHWVVGVRDPLDRIPYVARVSLSGRSIATSGKYEQFVAQDGRTFGHIIDPRTGWPAEGLLSVTVVAGTATEADAWGTACFVLGPAEAKRTALLQAGFQAILIQPGSEKDTLWVESSLRDAVSLEPAAREFLVLATF